MRRWLRLKLNWLSFKSVMNGGGGSSLATGVVVAIVVVVLALVVVVFIVVVAVVVVEIGVEVVFVCVTVGVVVDLFVGGSLVAKCSDLKSSLRLLMSASGVKRVEHATCSNSSSSSSGHKRANKHELIVCSSLWHVTRAL